MHGFQFLKLLSCSFRRTFKGINTAEIYDSALGKTFGQSAIDLTVISYANYEHLLEVIKSNLGPRPQKKILIPFRVSFKKKKIRREPASSLGKIAGRRSLMGRWEIKDRWIEGGHCIVLCWLLKPKTSLEVFSRSSARVNNIWGLTNRCHQHNEMLCQSDISMFF